ncbi:hypothetical protein GOP47_0021391 [Adiantum capillus-veneris]|uniref:Uncharacterized protein n=1 Tax=Adiantum capillus-veneris TaxID=13818 RepID=A0A9D4Z678_ADICA|nr:hypothetical protein GOP47_0021391 [Adiantum capillus-veneris]
MVGCPQLKQITVQSSFFKQGQLGFLSASVVSLQLHYLHTATELPDLSSSASTLQHLDVLLCERLERVNLKTGFGSLTTLNLCLCHNMVEIIGPGSLPSLRVLHVVDCRKVQSLKGFENSEMLEKFTLSGLRELSEFTLVGCPKLRTSVGKAHLCDMMGKLRARFVIWGSSEWVSSHDLLSLKILHPLFDSILGAVQQSKSSRIQTQHMMLHGKALGGGIQGRFSRMQS